MNMNIYHTNELYIVLSDSPVFAHESFERESPATSAHK